MDPTSEHAPDPTPTATVWDGARAISPVLVGVVPFGLVAGLTAVRTGEGVLGAVVFSVVVFAGAAQLTMLNLLAGGTSLAVVVVTALVVNARFVLYSASMAPQLTQTTRTRRLLGSYLLTDQAFAVATARFRTPLDAAGRWRFFLGSASVMWLVWQASTVLGALVGGAVPPGVPLAFAVPMAFLALAVPSVTDRPTLAAAVVSAVVAVAATPLGAGAFPLAAVAGITVGSVLALRAGRA